MLYSHNITPLSIISPPPYNLHKLLRWYIYLQFTFPSAIHGKFNKNRRTLRLQRTRGRLELTVPPHIDSSYLLASDTPTKRLVMQRQACSYLVEVRNYDCIAFSDRTLCAFIHSFMIGWPAELSHYELHRKPHKTVTDNSAIAVSLAHSAARKGGI